MRPCHFDSINQKIILLVLLYQSFTQYSMVLKYDNQYLPTPGNSTGSGSVWLDGGGLTPGRSAHGSGGWHSLVSSGTTTGPTPTVHHLDKDNYKFEKIAFKVHKVVKNQPRAKIKFQTILPFWEIFSSANRNISGVQLIYQLVLEEFNFKFPPKMRANLQF